MKLLCKLFGHKWEEVIVMGLVPPEEGGGMRSDHTVQMCRRCHVKKDDKKVHWPGGIRP